MRYLKLELTWATSEWLVVLSAEARLSWIMLLCHAKSGGINGRAKRLAPLIASRLWYVGEESVRQMETAAVANGALTIEDGDWVVTNWVKYQGDETNAERQRRFRECRKVPTVEPESNGSNALRNGSNGEEKRREEKIYNPPNPPSGGTVVGKGVFKPPTSQEVETEMLRRGWHPSWAEPKSQAFVAHYTSNGWKVGKNPMKDWKAAITTWASSARDKGIDIKAPPPHSAASSRPKGSYKLNPDGTVASA